MSLPSPRRAAAGPSAGAPTAPNPRDLVAALTHGLAVIEAFDQDRPRLTIAEVAQRSGLTRAAARRYLITLQHLGYVSSERRLFGLTARVLRLGQSYVHSARLPRSIDPELQRLAHALREASAAGVLVDDDVVCIAASRAGRLVSPAVQRGARMPAYCSASGRVLLGALPPARLEAWLARQARAPLAPLTPYTITDLARLRHEIEQAREQGHAAVDQEFELGMRTLAVPLLDFRGEVRAALDVSADAARVSAAQLIAHCLAPLRQVQVILRGTL